MSYHITGHTRLGCLLGTPVAHSISPMMYNEAFQLLGLDYVYLCFDVGTDTLKTAVEGLKALATNTTGSFDHFTISIFSLVSSCST